MAATTANTKFLYLIVNPNCTIEEKDQFYRVATGNTVKTPRGYFVREYIYIPKSQVNLTEHIGINDNNIRVFKIPALLFELNTSPYYRIGTVYTTLKKPCKIII